MLSFVVAALEDERFTPARRMEVQGLRKDEADMTPEEIRIECLKLALGNPHATDAVAEAQRYWNFVTGLPAKTPRELIDEALEAAGVR